jgi:hypothetical protein
MRLKRFILLFIGVLCTYCSSAQRQGEYVQARILIILDQSSSMIQPWAGGREKYKAARELILRLMDSVYNVNNQVQFGLRVFGHQHTVPENDCYDTKSEVAFSTDNKSQMFLRLEDIRPLGVTPITFALKEAAEKDIIDEEHYVYSIILITDGGESCGGDLCEVMKTLIKSKVYFKPYIVSLENDPALKITYACMGDYLQVTSNPDIPKAVSTIVESFRPRLQISKAEYKEIQANAPSVLKVNVQLKKTPSHAVENISAINELNFALFHITPPVLRLKTMNPVQLPAQDRNTISLTVLTPSGLKTFNTGSSVNFKPVLVSGTYKLPPVIKDSADERHAEIIAKLQPARLRQLNIIFVIEDRSFPMRKVPPMPPFKPTQEFINPGTTGDSKKHEYKTETEDNKETTLEVYFTNGSGKFYPTTPQVLLIDPSTNNVVKKFYRTVDAEGKPDPQNNIPPGVYDLTLATKRDFVVSGVKIEPNKKNKVIVTVKNTSLSFAYERTPGEKGPPRPVSEFRAIVTERNKAQGRVENQACTDRLLYEPGNYHIEINTFPMDMRNLDIDIDGEWVITIPQPGFAKFVSDGKVRSVDLFQHLGDKFVRFSTINLSDPRSQHLQIQPGKYQAHYQRGPGQSYATEQVKLFRIKPNEETQIDLN